MNTYTQLIDKHEGEICFIYGCGPSLYLNIFEDDFNEIVNRGIRIAVNSSVMVKDHFDYWISNDHLCVNWDWFSMVKKSKCTKIVRDSWEKYTEDIEGFYIFSPRKTSEGEIDFKDDGLSYCSSIPTSVDFSIKCGFKNIFLLGADHCLDNKTGYHHFWQFFPKEDQPRQLKPAQSLWACQKKVFKYNNMAYKALSKFAEYKDCKIYNCNPESKVEVFEKIEFKDIKNILGEQK